MYSYEVYPVNQRPRFSASPIQKTDAGVGVSYVNSIASDALDGDAGDTLTFSKVSGPVWLTVGTDGAITGRPGPGDEGVNRFVVRVEDSTGAPADGILQVTVQPGPHISGSCWTEEGLGFSLYAVFPGGVGTATYQWFRNGDPLPGETSAEYENPTPTQDDSGWYLCQVIDQGKAFYTAGPMEVTVYAPGSLPAAGWWGLVVEMVCVAFAAMAFLSSDRKGSLGKGKKIA